MGEMLYKGLNLELEATETTVPPEEAEDSDDDNLQGKRGLAPVEKKENRDYRSEILNYVAGRFDKTGALVEAVAPSAHENFTALSKKLRAELALAAWRKSILQGS